MQEVRAETRSQTQLPGGDLPDAGMSRAIGGLGMLLGVAVLLAIPLVLIAVRSARSRRRAAARSAAPGASVDAWSLSARRLGEES